MARLCISIPVHEELAVVFDQLHNIRAFLPSDTLVVLHLAQGFRSPEALQPMLPEGVYANTTSLKTAWGNVIDQHNANFRFINEREDFDYFLIHASNDLYIRRGVERYVERYDAGFQRTPLHPYIEACETEGAPAPVDPRIVVCQDAGIVAMAAELGVPIVHTQIEGIFVHREIMAKVVDAVDNHWHPGPDALIAPEHVYYPTAGSHYASNIGLTVVYSHAQTEATHQRITPPFVRRLRRGEHAEDPGEEWANRIGGEPADHQAIRQYDFENIYAVKRVERRYDDPVRRYVRALAQDVAEPLQLPKPEGFRGCNVLSFVEEVLEKPWVLEQFSDSFRSYDDIALIVWVPEEREAALLPLLDARVEEAGLTADGAADVIALMLPSSIDTEILLGGTCDFVSTDRHLTGPLEEVLPVPTRATTRLRALHSIGP